MRNTTAAAVITNARNVGYLEDYTQNHDLVPVNTTASPMQKSILISVAIVFWALGFVKEQTSFRLNPLNLSVSGLFIQGCVSFV